MISHASRPPPTAETVSAYEALRDHCLEPQAALGGELGLTVLLRDGMLTWSRVWRTCQPRASAQQHPSVSNSTVAYSASLHKTLVDVLVDMVTSAARPEHNAGANP